MNVYSIARSNNTWKQPKSGPINPSTLNARTVGYEDQRRWNKTEMYDRLFVNYAKTAVITLVVGVIEMFSPLTDSRTVSVNKNYQRIRREVKCFYLLLFFHAPNDDNLWPRRVYGVRWADNTTRAYRFNTADTGYGNMNFNYRL